MLALFSFFSEVGWAQPKSVTYYPTWCYGATNSDLKIHPRTGIPWQQLDIIVHFAATYEPSTAPYFGPVSNPQPDSLNLQYNLPNLGAGAYGNFQDTLIREAHKRGKQVLICWGVIGNGTQIFGDSVKVQQAVNAIAAYCQRKGYDGSDIDWEYPDNATNHGRYLRMMRKAFDALGDGKHYLVTTSSVNENTVYGSDNTPTWADQYVDYYFPQMYSLWSVWSSTAGYNIFTYNSPQKIDNSNKIAGQDGPYDWTNTGAMAMVAHGHAKSKVVNGVPGYGYYKAGSTLRGSQAPPDDMGHRYRELQGFLSRGGQRVWDDVAKQAWVSGTATSAYMGVAAGQQFCASYLDTQAVRARAQFVVDNGLGGLFTWDLEEGQQRPSDSSAANHPLETTIHQVFHGGTTQPAPKGSLNISPGQLSPGGGNVTLTWTSQDADAATITPGIGTVALNGSRSVQVSATTTFTLTLSGPGGTAVYSATVTVQTGAPSGTFAATPGQLPSGGGDVTLTWTSTNATAATITPAIGSVPVNGSRSVSLTETSTFTLTLTGPGGTATYNTTINVDGATPSTVVYDDSLHAPFVDQSWGIAETLSTTYVQSGKYSLKVNFSAWGGLQVQSGPTGAEQPIDPTQYDSLAFNVYPTTAGQLNVGFNNAGNVVVSATLDAWNGITVPLPSASFTRFWIQNWAGGTTEAYVDNIRLIPASGKTGVNPHPEIPKDYGLAQNYPNPFNPSTTIEFSLPRAETASLIVYDLLGNVVTTLVSGFATAGTHRVTWNAQTNSSGVYFYRLQAGSFSDVKRLVILK
jgi:GH18 family chitinase